MKSKFSIYILVKNINFNINFVCRWKALKDAVDDRLRNLLQSEKAQQYFFDAAEAESWMSEQELYMMVEDRGKDEISAQNLMKKHDTLTQDVEDYAKVIRQLGETARTLTQENHPHRFAQNNITIIMYVCYMIFSYFLFCVAIKSQSNNPKLISYTLV